MAVITDNGVNIQTLQEAIASNSASWTAITGDVDIAPSSTSGELIAIISEMDTRNQQTIADAFTQNTVTDATGENLDHIAEIKNQKRRTNQKSIVYIKLEGVDTTIIPEATIFVCSTNDEKFISDYEVTIDSGSAFVSATSIINAVVCPSETISLETPITDISSVTNQTSGEIGFDFESDAILRSRLQLIGSPFTNNLKEGLFLALTEIPNVAKVSILDNNTSSIIDGVPARTFSPVVFGGNRAEIAKTIYRNMGVGNPSFGDVSQLIISDITGDSYNVAFNVPIELLTVVSVILSTDATFNTSSGAEIVKENIIAYFESLKIGEDLLLQRVEGACLIQGVLSANVTLNGSSVNIFSTFKEIFVTNSSNVTVI